MCKLRYVGFLAAALGLAGCTGAPIMKADVSDYRTTFGDTNDEQILSNIIRARDGAPIHFSEMNTFGASMQLTSSLQATMPIGELYGSTTRAGLQGNLGAQNNPTFSMSTLETQAFTQGLLSPVKPTLLKQFFDEGIDGRLLLLLMFSTIQDRKGVHRNSFDCDPNTRCEDGVFGYLPVINNLQYRKLTPNIYTDLTQIGVAVPYKDATIKDLTGLDPLKFRVKVSMVAQQKQPDKSSVSVTVSGNATATGSATAKDEEPKKFETVRVPMATVYAISEPRFELCERKTAKAKGKSQFVLLTKVNNGAACLSEYFHKSAGPIAGRSTLQVRSAYQIIEYLGQVLAYQESRNRCIKLGDEDYGCGDGDVLFQVNSGLGDTLVSTSYQGLPYSVAVGPCRRGEYCDHSAEVLKILSLLINVNKSATDIQQIPLVRVQ